MSHLDSKGIISGDSSQVSNLRQLLQGPFVATTLLNAGNRTRTRLPYHASDSPNFRKRLTITGIKKILHKKWGIKNIFWAKPAEEVGCERAARP